MMSEIILFCVLLLPLTTLFPAKGCANGISHQAFRGWLALMIVVGHDFSRYFDSASGLWNFPYPKYLSALRMGIQTTGFLIVAVFFAFSAYGCRNYIRLGRAIDGNFLKKRLRQVYIPFLIIHLSLGILRKEIYSGITWKQLFMSCFDVNVWGVHWFIPHILIFYITFYCVYSSCTKYADAVICILYALFLMYNLAAVTSETFYVSEGGVVVGILYNRYEEQIERWTRKTWLAIIAAFFLIYNYPFLFWPNGIRFSLLDNGPIYRMLSASLAALICMQLVKRVDFSKNRILAFLGTISLEVYLVHSFCRVCTDTICSYVMGLGASKSVSWGIKNMLTIVLTIILSVLYHKLIQKVTRRGLRSEVAGTKAREKIV